MKCSKCGEIVKVEPGKSANFCFNCGNKMEAEKSGEWPLFDNTRDLFAFVAAEYGKEALFAKKNFSDHISPMMTQGMKKLLSEVYTCGLIEVIRADMNSGQSRKEAAIKRAVGKLTDIIISKEAAERIVGEFISALGWVPAPATVNVRMYHPTNGSDLDVGLPSNIVLRDVFDQLADANFLVAGQSYNAVIKSSGKKLDNTKTIGENGVGENAAIQIAMPQAQSNKPKHSTIVLPNNVPKDDGLGVTPHIGSVIKVANIDWLVLDVDKAQNRALLISEKILEKRPYNTEYVDITWERCTLRQYLNGEFYNKLGAAKSAIADTQNNNPKNPWYGISGGNATSDKIFLLNLDEVVKYFGDSGALAQKKGKEIEYFYWENSKWNKIDKPDTSKWCCFYDQYNNARIANYGSEGASWWWLRSPGDNSSRAASVSTDGCVFVYGYFILYSASSGGVRPALWLNL